MQTSYATISDIFGLPRRYTVPLFQRPYVWTEKAQWEPLWADVCRLADAARAGVSPPPHFLGSIVLEKVPTQSYPERRDVIDGQQRLTTLQLLLKAAQDSFTAIGEQQRALQLASMLRNHAIGAVDEEQTFKVLPTNVDREAYRLVMQAASPADLTGVGGLLPDAYRYFYAQLSSWLAAHAPSPGQARDALFVTLNQRLKCVVLDLDQTDEAQVIFETLNARGTPLLPADLVKNWLLREVERRGLHGNIEQLYASTWHAFDSDHIYWRKEAGRGHAARARIDTYLANYLTLHLRRPVSATHLYSEFLDLQAREDLPPIGAADGLTTNPVARLEDIRKHAAGFRRVDEADEPGRIGTSLRRLKAMDVVSLTPFFLWLFGRPVTNDGDTTAVVEALESFLVRRMVCDLDTRAYTTFFVDLLAAAAQTPNSDPVAPVVRQFLGKSQAEGSRWPGDAEFKKAWLSEPLYRRLTRPRLRMMLLAIEARLHSQFSEAVTLTDEKLQIEHVMPQSWEDHWPLPPAQDLISAKDRRNALLHTIGNLTLVTKKLNPSLSNAPWLATSPAGKSKRAGLHSHSILRLNYNLVHDNEDGWNEEKIEARGTCLLQHAIAIWPPPST
ncbi:DUF262 domain-containing protein [Neoroseomonas soli]|uniref:DUF262 domain-containing protein n=1 Tax=Neoroseomonas soli TaxID=1081025 RepID=A0A9X9WRZ8_9PROT|nr:DUF262 domain-containing protein [Neoroseomonas soli]MBR0669927.1 DUF262 domain-containing protein [Neoroseomonas soli]